MEHRNPVTHLLLHDGHGGSRQQEGLEGHQVPEGVLHFVVAGDDIGPGLADGAEENRPWGGQRKTGVLSAGRPWPGTRTTPLRRRAHTCTVSQEARHTRLLPDAIYRKV